MCTVVGCLIAAFLLGELVARETGREELLVAQ